MRRLPALYTVGTPNPRVWHDSGGFNVRARLNLQAWDSLSSVRDVVNAFRYGLVTGNGFMLYIAVTISLNESLFEQNISNANPSLSLPSVFTNIYCDFGPILTLIST